MEVRTVPKHFYVEYVSILNHQIVSPNIIVCSLELCLNGCNKFLFGTTMMQSSKKILKMQTTFIQM